MTVPIAIYTWKLVSSTFNGDAHLIHSLKEYEKILDN